MPYAKIMKISKPVSIDFNTITTLVFDWGGVITNIDPEATINAFAELGHRSFPNYFNGAVHDTLFLQFEKGEVNDEEIYARLRSAIGKPVPEDKLKQALCAMLLDTPVSRLKLLEKLKQKFRLLLLSNTNSIHSGYYNNYLLHKYKIDFKSLFDKVYYSHEIGMRKPDSEIFQYVLSDAGLNPVETLFIDDSEINIGVARSLNIQCIHLDNSITMEDVFTDQINF